MKNFKNENIKIVYHGFVEIIYQAAIIEDKGITFAETYNIINNYEQSKNRIDRDKADIIVGLKRAYQYVIDRANDDNPVIVYDIRHINKLIDFYEEDNAGKWRSDSVRIHGSSRIPTTLGTDGSISFVESKMKINSFEEGVISLAKLCKQQLFPNGNKRTGLCFTNLCLLKKDLPVIQVVDRAKYVEKLVNYYEDEGKLNEFVEFVKTESLGEENK
ncbi:MAG: hypothetical protein LBC44_03815 [Mycoplasmataceae bacterium]|jgi:Fic family protein|nr:hypothetical protein [Mycoplasmataceae bacterium]